MHTLYNSKAAPGSMQAILAAQDIDRIAEAVAERLGAMPERVLLDLKQAAHVAGVTAPVIRHWVSDEWVPAQLVRRIGSRIFLERKGFEQWLLQR